MRQQERSVSSGKGVLCAQQHGADHAAGFRSGEGADAHGNAARGIACKARTSFPFSVCVQETYASLVSACRKMPFALIVARLYSRGSCPTERKMFLQHPACPHTERQRHRYRPGSSPFCRHANVSFQPGTMPGHCHRLVTVDDSYRKRLLSVPADAQAAAGTPLLCTAKLHRQLLPQTVPAVSICAVVIRRYRRKAPSSRNAARSRLVVTESLAGCCEVQPNQPGNPQPYHFPFHLCPVLNP